MAAKRGRRKKARKTTRRKTTRRTSPLGNLAKKVQGIDSRVHSLEGLSKRFVKRKWKGGQRLGDIEARGHKYWASGE